jgi:hypothetical protein
MIGDRTHLGWHIIRILAGTQGLAAGALRERATTVAGREYSIQGVHKELNKLQKEGVVYKVGGAYGLRLPWVLEFISQADTMADTYVERPQLAHILSDTDKKEIWHFTDLLKLNDFWGHVLVALVQQSKSKVLLGWNPHPWFHLAQTKQEDQYMQALKRAQAKLYLIVGGSSVLDKWTEKFWEKGIVQYSFGKSSLHGERATYLNVIDDYVLTIKLDARTAKAIDTLYDDTKSMNDIDMQGILSIFCGKTKATMWLEKNPVKAKNIKTRFKKYWGIDFNVSKHR